MCWSPVDERAASSCMALVPSSTSTRSHRRDFISMCGLPRVTNQGRQVARDRAGRRFAIAHRGYGKQQAFPGNRSILLSAFYWHGYIKRIGAEQVMSRAARLRKYVDDGVAGGGITGRRQARRTATYLLTDNFVRGHIRTDSPDATKRFVGRIRSRAVRDTTWLRCA